jgi:hypothetical protein
MEKFGVIKKTVYQFDPSAWTVGRAYRISIWEPSDMRLDVIEAHDGLYLGFDEEDGELRFIIIENGEDSPFRVTVDDYISGRVSIMPYPFKPKEKEEK